MSSRCAPDRVARGVLLAGCSAALSVAAHALGGGRLPHLLPTIALSVLIGWLSTSLAGQTRGVGGTLLVLSGAQVTTHVVLGELSGHSVESPLMVSSHVVATVAIAVVLAYAEAMLGVAVSVVSALRGLLLVLWSAPMPPVEAPCGNAVRAAADTRAVTVLLRRAHPRRGPPATS